VSSLKFSEINSTTIYFISKEYTWKRKY